MKTKIEVECKPWSIPNFINVVGIEKSIAIADAPRDLVESMLQQFTSEVWAKHQAPKVRESE